MKKYVCELTVIVILLCSCVSRNQGYVITGEVTGFPDSTIIYLWNFDTQEDIDSALILKNHFAMKGVFEEVPGSFWLTGRVNGQSFYTNMLIGNDRIVVKGDLRDFPFSVQITGSEMQDGRNKSDKLINPYYQQRDSLVLCLFSLSEEEQKTRETEIWAEVAEIDKKIASLRTGYIRDNPTVYYSVIELNFLKHILPKDTITALYACFTPEMKNSKEGRLLDSFLKNNVAGVGDICPDFEAIDKDDNKIIFSQIQGDYILLDFSTIGCGACILSVKELKKINDTYSDSLTIVGFNCDVKKELWLNSLVRDSVNWLSVWDGKGVAGEAFLRYGIDGYPTFVLIGPDRKIIDKWSGYGEGSLEERLVRFRK